MIEGVGLFLAGLIGGMVNAIAGGGSFITFPALMAAGVSPSLPMPPIPLRQVPAT